MARHARRANPGEELTAGSHTAVRVLASALDLPDQTAAREAARDQAYMHMRSDQCPRRYLRLSALVRLVDSIGSHASALCKFVILSRVRPTVRNMGST
jgi:hypothetical protein